MKSARVIGVLGMAVSATLALAACGGSSPSSSSSAGASSGSPITVLIGSSGDAETASVKQAVAAWSAQSGTPASVQVASDLNQQLTQGFTGGNPPDVFYLSTDQLAGYAANGSLDAYGDQLPNKNDFYPNLTAAFTVNGQLQCAPKDFSTLALIINTTMWKQAGLTQADIPKTWAQLEADAKKLTTGKVVGLTMSPQIERIGAFLPQAGGALQSADGTQATVDSPQNLQALDFVKKMQDEGVLKFSSDLGTGWGGEAFGKQLAAMTVEGNWISGAMKSDYPGVKWQAAELPAGPAGKGTLAFTNCWGIAADSKNQSGAVDLVKFLTTTQQQDKFADAFGVLPSVKSAAETWAAKNPAYQPFIAGADYAKTLPSQQGASDVIADFDSQLQNLKGTDPKQMLSTVQQELQATVG